MEKSFRGQKHVCSNCNTKFFDFNKEKIVCPNCKTEKIIPKKVPISSLGINTEQKVEKVEDDLDGMSSTLEKLVDATLIVLTCWPPTLLTTADAFTPSVPVLSKTTLSSTL